MSNEAENVVAEVIEEQDASSLTVAYKPSVIEANFDALEAHVRKTVEAYDGATYDLTKKENIAEAKHDRSYLNGLKKEIDERRKAVKREYNKPLDAFERRCKQITAIIDESADAIKAQLDEAEERRRAGARAALEAHYREFAELLAPVVPYERLHDDKWLNKSFGEVKAKKALEDKVSAVARDWDTLKAQRDSMAHYEVAERELFRRDTGEEPVLLLDDVLSELDARRQDFVLNQIRSGQVLITCCEPDRLSDIGKRILIENGQVREDPACI